MTDAVGTFITRLERLEAQALAGDEDAVRTLARIRRLEAQALAGDEDAAQALACVASASGCDIVEKIVEAVRNGEVLGDIAVQYHTHPPVIRKIALTANALPKITSSSDAWTKHPSVKPRRTKYVRRLLLPPNE